MKSHASSSTKLIQGTGMPLRNSRRSVTESYDPKQRIVGGLMLFLLVLLIYSVLKLVLGFSSASEGEYTLSAPLKDEELPSEVAHSGNKTQHSTASASVTASSQKASHNLPQGFVFLDINGNPMQQEQRTFVDNSDPFTQTGEDQWYVQAASFRTETGAQSLARKIKAKDIADQVHIIQSSNGWYAVRLSPQNEHGEVKQQYRKLRRLLYLKPIIRKVN
jgi:hypothetical protein